MKKLAYLHDRIDFKKELTSYSFMDHLGGIMQAEKN
jgi:hypothetical protein